MGPQARDPSSQGTLFLQVQRNARESGAAPSAPLPLEAGWMLSVLEMKQVLAHSVVNCFVNFAERKQEENRDWRRKKSGLEGRGRVTGPVPSGNHRPKLALSDPLSCCPRGLGVSAPSGKPSTHSVRSALHCAPPSPTPCPLPWRAGEAIGTRHPPRGRCGSCAYSSVHDLQVTRGSIPGVLARVAALSARVPPSVTVRRQCTHMSR